MKNILIISLLLISSFSFAQEFDNTYLESLPKEVKADIEDKMNARKEVEKPVYRRASSFVDKKDDSISSIFGSNFFDVMQSSFMPINEPNLDPSYILDFGDVIEIQTIGQQDKIDTYPINRDGSINLPDIGKIMLSGLPLKDASELIKAKIKSTYIGTEAFITLKNIRDINILIVGNAFNPGIYTLNGNSNMLHALSMAGGINEDMGSYRSIDLVRSGKIIDSLDIYEVLVYGKYDFSNGLRSGDSIVVNPRGKIVSFESGALNSAVYELKDNEVFEDLLNFANGFSKNNDYKNIFVKRILNGKSEIINLTLDELYKFNFVDNDSIFIREYKVDNVLISGHVKNPGNYKFNQGTTLSQAIKFAGGYQSSAYPFGGYLENRRALSANKQAKEKLYEAFLTNLITNRISETGDNSGLGSLLLELKNATPSGRIIAEFDTEVIENDRSLDTILENGDRIYIPQITQQVYIHGEISNPGAIRYSPGMDIDYYIKKAGSFLDTADKDSIFIIHPNGETETHTKNSSLSFIKENKRELVYPGSIIYVPQKTNFASSIQVASIWAPIISSIALSLTSLSVLNNTN